MKRIFTDCVDHDWHGIFVELGSFTKTQAYAPFMAEFEPTDSDLIILDYFDDLEAFVDLYGLQNKKGNPFVFIIKLVSQSERNSQKFQDWVDKGLYVCDLDWVPELIFELLFVTEIERETMSADKPKIFSVNTRNNVELFLEEMTPVFD